MKKFLLLLFVACFYCCFAAEDVFYMEIAPEMPSGVFRSYRYFQYDGVSYEGKKGTIVGCAKSEADLSEMQQTICEESPRVVQLIKILKNKKYSDASDYFYQNFLLNGGMFLGLYTDLGFYVRPYKKGLLILNAKHGQDGPLFYVLNYLALDSKGNMAVFSNDMYTSAQVYNGWGYSDLNGYSIVGSKKYLPIPTMSKSFYEYTNLNRDDSVLKKFNSLKFNFKDGPGYLDKLKIYKNPIAWFKKLDLNRFLDSNNKKLYILEKPISQ